MLGMAVPTAIATAAPVAAEDYTNITASGRVQDAKGKPIADAKVEIVATELGVSRAAQTNAAGVYKILQLSPGTYSFRVSAHGYDTYKEDGVRLSSGYAGNTFTLNAAGEEIESVVVTGIRANSRARTVDFEHTTTGSAIDIAELDMRVPIGRSLRDVALLSPGVVQGGASNNSTFSDQVNVSGAIFTENAYYLNGLNITNFRMGLSPVEVPYDFYETIDVKTGGFPAEYGRATGGVIIATTKSGSNEFHASLLESWEPDDLRSTSPNTYWDRNKNAKASKNELTAQFSGPIIKDHLFFYALYSQRDASTFTPDNNQDDATRKHNSSPFWGGKIDAYITDGQHLEFTYFDSTNNTHTRTFDYDRLTDTRGDMTGGTNSRSGGQNYVARYTGAFTDWFTLSVAYGKNKLRDGSLPLDTTHERVIDYRTDDSGVDIGVNRVTDAMSFNNDQRVFYRADADLNFDFFGTHHVRVGFDREEDTADQFYETIGNGFYKLYAVKDVATDPTGLPLGTQYVTTRVYRNDGNFKTVNQAFYGEDNWSLFDNRLTLQLGLRYDNFDNRDAGGKTFYDSGDQWGPRLGFSGDLFGDGRTKVFGSFGRYYLPMPANTNLSFAGAVATYTRYNLLNGVGADGTPVVGDPIVTAAGVSACPDTGVANCVVSRDGSVSDPVNSIAQNLKPQSSDEYILGASHRLDELISFGLYYTHRSLNAVLEDAAIDRGAVAYCVGAGFSQSACSSIYTGGSQFVLINPGYDVVVKLNRLPDGTSPTVRLTAAQLGYDKAKRDYNALTFTFNRDFDGVWSLGGSYTFAMDKGNYEGGVSSDTGQLAVNLSAAFDSPGFQNGSYGYLPNDRRHTLKMYGSYRVVPWLDLGFNALLQAPRHYSCIGIVPASVDAYANGYRGYGFYCQGQQVDRGTAFDGDWLSQVDASAVARLPAPEGYEASLRLDVFNIFNLKSKTGYSEYGDNSDGTRATNFGKPTDYQTPRYVRMQLRIGF